MTIEQVRALYTAQPFHQFVIHLADGRSVEVPHREFMALGPTGRTVFVYKPDESFHIIDLLLVTDIEITKTNGSRRRKR